MMQNVMHVVSFDVPFPADYGGVIDIYYRLRALKNSGIKVHLHAYQYGRDKTDELNKVCESVTYYKRNNTLAKQLSILPFIVASRNNDDLLKNLLKDDFPILFEGLHTCYFLNHPDLKGREKIIRMHNVEHDYYNYLGQHESKLWKRAFFKLEAGKLSRFENTISYATKIVAISKGDYYYFHKLHQNTCYIPASHPYDEVTSQLGKGDFILYHGNLSVPENNEAALMIIDEIAPKINHQIIIAGKNPDKKLQKKISQLNNVTIIENPDKAKMDELIKDAHIHLLPSVQNTGLKLKLLYSLFAGRYVIANSVMVDNSGLDEACHIHSTPESILKCIKKLMQKDFSSDEFKLRQQNLSEYYPAVYQKKWKEVIFG